jgi:hypothetical protein
MSLQDLYITLGSGLGDQRGVVPIRARSLYYRKRNTMRYTTFAVIPALLPAALLFAMAGPEAFAQSAGKTITIKGRVLDFDQKPISGEHAKVFVRVTGDREWTEHECGDDGSYGFQISIPSGRRIEDITFTQTGMHPASVTELSGDDQTHIINKLLAGPFDKEPCPNEYYALCDQLLTLERLYYWRVATRRASLAEVDYYKKSLQQIVGPESKFGRKIYAEMGQPKADVLTKKRAELFRLYERWYEVNRVVETEFAALGCCAKCTLKLMKDDKCRSAFVALKDGQIRVFLIVGAEGDEKSRSHKIVCHSSVGVRVKGEVVRDSSVERDGTVVVGEFRATSFDEDAGPRENQTDDLLIAGFGKCECKYDAPGAICENIISAVKDHDPVFYRLHDKNAVGNVHMLGESYVIRGKLERPLGRAPNWPKAWSGYFQATHVTPLKLPGGNQ